MGAFAELQSAFVSVQGDFLASASLEHALRSGITVAQYASYLKQIFHHTRENPQIQALATVYFRGHQRAAIKRFFRHATSEIGHDQLARDDLRALGMDEDSLPYQNPLPETTALIAFPFYQIHNLNPVGYLGYLYFLEFLPTGSGGRIMAALKAAGIPEEAMSFLHDHATIDVGHNRFMEEYAEALITSERELQSAIYAMKVTGRLYARMIEASFAEVAMPRDWGMSTEECVDVESESADRDWARQTGERPRVQWPPVADAPSVARRR